MVTKKMIQMGLVQTENEHNLLIFITVLSLQKMPKIEEFR